MTPVEKLFVQIFERKNRIIQQVKQQADLYEQHLASKCLVEGITPPSWLWNDNPNLDVPKELNGEDLISEILLPNPRHVIRFPDTSCSLYDKSVGKRDEGVQAGGSIEEPYSNNESLDHGNEEGVASGCIGNNTISNINVLPEFDISVTTNPQSIIGFPGAGCSLYNHPIGEGSEGLIVAKTFVDSRNELGVASDCIEDNTRCNMNVVPDYAINTTSPHDGTEKTISSILSAPDQSVARIQRSKSRQKALELRNSAKTESRSRLNKQIDPVGSSLTNRLFMNCPTVDQVTEIKGLGEPGCSNSEHYGPGRTGEGDEENNNKEKGFNSCTGVFSGSRICNNQPISAMNLEKGDIVAYTFNEDDKNASEDGEDFSQCSKVVNLLQKAINSDVTAESRNFFETMSTNGCLSSMAKKSEACGERISSVSIDEDCHRHIEKSETRGERISSSGVSPDQAPEKDILDRFGMVEDKCLDKPVQQLDDINDFVSLTGHPMGLVHDEVRSQTISGDEEMPKLHQASTIAGPDTNSICGAKVNPQSARHGAWNSSDCQVILPSTDSHDDGNQLREFETIASDVIVNDEPAISRPISCDASLYGSLTRPSSDYVVFMEPKQLVFDEREEFSFRDKSSVIVERKRLETSPVQVFDASLHPPSSSDLDTSSPVMIHQKLSIVERESSTKRVEVGACSFKRNIQEHDDMQIKAKGAHSYEYSVLKNVVVDSESVQSPKFSCPVDFMPPNPIEDPDMEDSVSLNCKEVSEPELQDADGVIHKEGTSASHNSESNLLMASNSSSAEKAIGVCSIEEVGDLGSASILLSSEGQNRVEENQNLSNLESECCSGYTNNFSNSQQVLDSSSLGVNDFLTRGSVGSPLAGCEIFDISESKELQISTKFQNLRSAKMDSWPKSKRRRIQDKETDCLSASPSFRVKKHYPSQMESASVKRVGEDTETVLGVASPVYESAQMEVYHNMPPQLTGKTESSSKLQYEKLAMTSEVLGELAEATSSSSLNLVVDPSIFNFTKGLARYSQLVEESTLAAASANVMDGNDLEDHSKGLHSEGKGNLENGESLMMERSHLHDKSYLRSDGHLPGALDLPLPKSNLDLTDQMMPVLEGFIIDPLTEHEEVEVHGHAINFDELELPRASIERASLLEQICISTIKQTPSNHFSSPFKLNESTNFCHSVPNGLLEYMDLGSISTLKDDIQKQLRGSYMYQASSHSLQKMSHSNSLPGVGDRYGLYSRTVSTHPVRKLWERIPLHTGSSEKQLSSNPELTCFPIEEDPNFTEENGNTCAMTEKLQEDKNSVVDTCAEREPLANITEDNAWTSISAAEKSVDRASLDSISEVSFKGMYKKAKSKVQSYCKKNSEDKENDMLTIAASDMEKPKESTTSKFRKTSPSHGTSLKRDMQKLSEKEPNRNNIVSNLTSFVPLVKQKQAAAVCTGKRDVKVKALEIAEAAKVLEAKKENERKMRKEAMKLERARMEQENLRQMELTKKKKEEETKKRDADIAAKKRHREEEERKEKERKRKRIEGTQKMRREEGTLRTQKVEKEKRLRDIDGREAKAKESDNQSQKIDTLVKNVRVGMTIDKPEILRESEDPTFQVGISLEACATSGESHEHVEANATLDRSGSTDNMTAQKNEEKSYEISPYHCSDDDDDDEEEEEERNQKFIPSWASKDSVALILPMQQHIRPDLIFPPDSFCRIDEVCPSQLKRIIKMKGQK